ncbi:hypothetical protein IPL68_03700 [Candidatus Saccharibacteria bacterium]|nr:MAG: hypothetical protein IPL68_03700 [Candidatus Saccharibacteria bacterium]
MQAAKPKGFTKLTVWISGFLLLTVLCFGLMARIGMALSTQGPDPLDMGMGATDIAAYVLAEQGSSINVRSITIPLYLMMLAPIEHSPSQGLICVQTQGTLRRQAGTITVTRGCKWWYWCGKRSARRQKHYQPERTRTEYAIW